MGRYDTAGASRYVSSVEARDSFAFVSWPVPRMLSIDVSDSRHPLRAAGCDGMFGPPEDMVLRDSLVYCAEGRRLQVVNVARPRSPVLVGSCVLPGTPGKMVLSDSVAYAATYGVQCVNVADPDSPLIVGAYDTRVSGLDVVDTVVYGAGPYTGLIALSTADPTAPHLLDSLYLTDTLWWNDVVVVDSLAYVGGDRIWVVDVSDPRNLRLVPGGSWTPPYLIRRLTYSAPYLYAACYEAGVCILETVMTGLAEQSGPRLRPMGFSVRPSMAGAVALLEVNGLQGAAYARLCDVTGRRLDEHRLTAADGKASWELKLTGLPAGVYLVSVQDGSRRLTAKVVRTER